MNGITLLYAMNGIDSDHLLCAQQRLGYDAPARRFPLRKLLALAAAALILLSVCFTTALAVSPAFRQRVFAFLGIREPAVVPQAPEEGETLTVDPEKITIGGVVEGTYLHMPTASHAGNGVFLVSTDAIAMNSGNHYDAYVEQDGQLVKLESRSFSGDYTVLGTEFHLEFTWAEHNGGCVVTYSNADGNYSIRRGGGVQATLVQFSCPVGESYTDYPVLIDLETGALTDVLQGTGAESLPQIGNAVITGDMGTMLLACADGSLYLADLEAKTLHALDELSGQHADACSLLGDTLACWALEGADIETAQLGHYQAWAIDLTTGQRRELFSSIPATGATSADVWNQTYGVFLDAPEAWAQFGWVELPPVSQAGLQFLMGFDRARHGSFSYTGSAFALEAAADRQVFVIDLATGERLLLEGFLWPQEENPDIQCLPSPDGRKLLVAYWQEGLYQEVGVVDFDRQQYLTFSRENLTDNCEHGIRWFDENSILIDAYQEEGLRDYYLFRLLG